MLCRQIILAAVFCAGDALANRHPVGWRIGEGLEDIYAMGLGLLQDPALPCVRIPVPLAGAGLEAFHFSVTGHGVQRGIFAATNIVAHDVQAESLYGIEDFFHVVVSIGIRQSAHNICPPGQRNAPAFKSLVADRGIDKGGRVSLGSETSPSQEREESESA